jgi:serine/threonine protein kinase
MNKVTVDAKNLIASMLVKDVKKRPTAEQVLQHPWIHRTEIPSVVTIDYSRFR